MTAHEARCRDAIYVIEWKHPLHDKWRWWSHRFTERAARKWIERQKEQADNADYRIVRYLREGD